MSVKTFFKRSPKSSGSEHSARPAEFSSADMLSPPASHASSLSQTANGAPHIKHIDSKAPAKHSNRSWVWLLFSASLFAIGWYVGGAIKNRPVKEALPPGFNSAIVADESVVPVTIEPAAYRPVQRKIESIGTLNGYEEISVSSRVSGLVSELHFEVGDRFQPGDLLLEIDPTDYELAVQQADRSLLVELAKLGLTEPPESEIDLDTLPTVLMTLTRLENSKRRADRAQQLLESNSISTEEFDNTASEYRTTQAEYANQLLLARAYLATVRMRQADLAVAKKKLSDTKVQATPLTRPIPGLSEGVTYVVTERWVSEGNLVQPGTEICKLVVDRTLKLNLAIPERHTTEIQVGQKANVHTAAYPQPFEGTVTRIDPSVDTATRTFDVEVQVPNLNGQLKTGSFAKAEILTRVEADATTVPLSALVSFAGINKIYVMEGDVAREVQVTLGEQTSDWVEITAPRLPAGTPVITSGHSQIADQSPVRIREEGTE